MAVLRETRKLNPWRQRHKPNRLLPCWRLHDAVALAPGAPSEQTAGMPIEVKSFLAARRFAAEKMQKMNLFETGRLYCDVYCLEPGQAQKVHAHEGSDKIYAVLEGAVEAQIGEERRAPDSQRSRCASSK
jgi:mannose-6-phosphate isomerase-like protein (cupin superfamily)